MHRDFEPMRFMVGSSGPVFNHCTGFEFFNATAETQRMEILTMEVKVHEKHKHSMKKPLQ